MSSDDPSEATVWELVHQQMHNTLSSIGNTNDQIALRYAQAPPSCHRLSAVVVSCQPYCLCRHVALITACQLPLGHGRSLGSHCSRPAHVSWRGVCLILSCMSCIAYLAELSSSTAFLNYLPCHRYHLCQSSCHLCHYHLVIFVTIILSPLSSPRLGLTPPISATTWPHSSRAG